MMIKDILFSGKNIMKSDRDLDKKEFIALLGKAFDREIKWPQQAKKFIGTRSEMDFKESSFKKYQSFEELLQEM